MGFLVTFLIPGIVILSVAVGATYGYPNLAIWAPLFVGYVIVPIVQMRWPREIETPPERVASPAWTAFYRILPLLALPAQLAMLAVTTAAFVSGRYDALGLIVLTVTTGMFSAMFAVNIAHELIHRRERLDRILGGLLLSTVSFGSFKIVHLQVHHPYVGTPLDFATARRGQNIYSLTSSRPSDASASACAGRAGRSGPASSCRGPCVRFCCWRRRCTGAGRWAGSSS
jgi:alkane 1-monooxygenase